MKKKLIIAVYKKESAATDVFVGVFLKDLFGPPLFETKTSLNRDNIVIENNIITQVTDLVQDFRHKIIISFFDNYEIFKDRDHQVKYFFIKLERYLDVRFIVEKIKF
jgi:hypothetical protein